jgi:Raf kinase inhibitor-like YbhB/YbcL family protein
MKHATHTFVAAAFTLLAAASSATAFELTSKDIAIGQTIDQAFVLNDFGCTGQNHSPELAWSNAPEGTKSFAVFVHDPDAKTGGAGFWHWSVIDIPATATGLARDAGLKDGKTLPSGARQVATDFGAPGWGGPCPPQGEKAHRYNFTVYALKLAKLELPPHPTASLAGFVVNANALASAAFTAPYGR